MGAWGHGFFENDDVLDWKAELLETSGTDVIEEVLNEVLLQEYVEGDIAAQALGAAEIIAALNGKAGKEILEKNSYVSDLVEWIRSNEGKGKNLKGIAVKAVKKIRTESELRELWEETDEYKAWTEIVKDLENRLNDKNFFNKLFGNKG
ncbi:hypothetical protein PAESOLCIP111_06618 [Paenibacillus solanacearum]|uniref:DUF4259 domain-containing protein n=1 Tax=Paenibacillus solanacearum TaxID=2048548 RepID=A0A916K890_9BACL|nr:DUF4259 domain-containing protein [Paenibacillus solanacearum]CAG7652752.1 hypothetical protein PAESOLCIP111_06618 [Paenibacillus solanacearum]